MSEIANEIRASIRRHASKSAYQPKLSLRPVGPDVLDDDGGYIGDAIFSVGYCCRN